MLSLFNFHRQKMFMCRCKIGEIKTKIFDILLHVYICSKFCDFIFKIFYQFNNTFVDIFRLFIKWGILYEMKLAVI